MTVYVAADIGCIECGERSDVRVFTGREAAAAWLLEAQTAQREDWHGQHHFQLAEAEVDGGSRWVAWEPVEATE